jgi:hypothetical protein
MGTPLQYTEAGTISKLEVFSKKVNGSKDLSAGVVVCDYFESILDNTIRFSIVIVDTGSEQGGGESTSSAIHSLKLSGSEKVHLTISDAYGTKLKFEGPDNALYIHEIRNIISSSETTIYTLELVSLEFIANDFLACEVYRRYDGKISDSASSILNDILKTKKNVILDETANKYNFIGEGKKPFRLLAEIATKGVPASASNTAGYLIYETYAGFNFRSIDSLFNEKTYKSFIYNSTVLLPKGYDGKIIEYDGDNAINVGKNLQSGAYGAKLETIDTFTHVYTKSQEIDTEEQKVHGGKEAPKLAEDFSSYGSTASRRFCKINSVGELPEGSVSEQLEKATEPNLKLEDVIVQAAMTYNKLFTLQITVVVPGDYGIRAGALVHCDFPEQSSKDQTEIDKEMSGVYLVSDVCTHLTAKTTLTKMRLVRDSHGRTANTTSSSSSDSSGTDTDTLNSTNTNSTRVDDGKTVDRTSSTSNPNYGTDIRNRDVNARGSFDPRYDRR